MAANWYIYRINYVYPSVNNDIPLPSEEYGSINIESVFLTNKDDVVQINFENNYENNFEILVELTFGKTLDDTLRNIKWEDSPCDGLSALNIIDVNQLGCNPWDIVFFGTENDEDGNFTTKQNVSFVKKGNYGRYVKIDNVTGPILDNMNYDILIKMIRKVIDIIKTIQPI
jgi:hypothetical protein